MSRIYGFLESLSDKELAYFIKFKKAKYTIETQKIIEDYIFEKNFTKSKIDELVSSKFFTSKDQTQVCPRCGSHNFLINNVQYTNNLGDSGIKDEIEFTDYLLSGKVAKRDEVICNVCDYLVKDPNNRGPKKKLYINSFWRILDWLLD